MFRKFTAWRKKRAIKLLKVELAQIDKEHAAEVGHWKDLQRTAEAYAQRMSGQAAEHARNTLICDAMLDTVREDADELRKANHRLQQNLITAVDRLEQISELLPNKASANGTAKKMARIAAEAIQTIEKEEANG